jgi:3-hydroxybutyryl-CoA dehydrogenase
MSTATNPAANQAVNPAGGTAGTPGTPPEIERVGVVGCGLMGAGVAEVCARAGRDVRVVVSSPSSLAASRKRVADSLSRSVAKGKTTEDEQEEIWSRISFTPDLVELADRQLVIESIAEERQAKVELFTSLDKIVEDPGAVLATNTSTLSIMGIAGSLSHPKRVLGMHFFSPAQLMPLVELIPSLQTDEAVLARAEHFVTATLGKEAIRSADRTGFVVNALLVPYLLAAVRMVESGFATPETIDKGMMLGCSYPVGPLKLVDLIGLDVLNSASNALYEEFKAPLYAPPPLLVRMVEGRLLGKKTGRGFYNYT